MTGRRLFGLVVMVGAALLAACAPPVLVTVEPLEKPTIAVNVPCTRKSDAVPETDPHIIQGFPILEVFDGMGDLYVLNPLHVYFQDEIRETFGLEEMDCLYCDYDIGLVPPVLDVEAVAVSRAEEEWRFLVGMPAVGESELGFPQLVSSGQARVAIHLDIDLDTISDAMVTTAVTDGEALLMVAVDGNFEPLESREEILAEWDEAAGQLAVVIPDSIAGEHFDWTLVTGFAADPGATCSAVGNERVLWVPTVDIVAGNCIGCAGGEETPILFDYSFQFSSPCQVFREHTVTGYYDCPTPGKPTKPLPSPIKPGPSGQTDGWLVLGDYCGNRKTELYCSKDWIGWVDNGTKAGWFAHCCFGGGQNARAIIDTNGDNYPEGWSHTVATPSGSSKVEYVYYFGPPYKYSMIRSSGTSSKTCANLQLTDYPWGLPSSLCSFP